MAARKKSKKRSRPKAPAEGSSGADGQSGTPSRGEARVAGEAAAEPGEERRTPLDEHDPVAIVGVGASAGGFEAFRELLQPMPADSGLAFVFVQHLAPSHDSALTRLLSAATMLPVIEATEGMRLERDQVYVIPPNVEMSIAGGRLHLSPRSESATPRLPIDMFLSSLAADVGARAIGVILSGNAYDGAAGLRLIKAEGGIALAQDPESAKFDSMPRAATATGIVDIVLPPAGLAAELVRIARHPYLHHVRPRFAGDEIVVHDLHLQRIFGVLRKATGVDFASYKPPTIRRRLQRRMALHKLTDVEQYLKLLDRNPAEVQALYSDILIRVTRFFREPGSFAVLGQTVFPQIVDGRRGEQPVRIWVPGCSTGEEPYSVAIELLEFLDERKLHLPVQVFATDVSEAAIEHARVGQYPQTIVADVGTERLRQWFTKTDGHYRINKRVRDLCVFARQDLSRDPPFSKLDLIVCRNVLIYMGQQLQRKLMAVFHYALRSGGFLMLGSAETTGSYTEYFAVADKKHRIFCRRDADTAANVVVTGDVREPPLPRAPASIRPVPDARGAAGAQHEATRLMLSRYAPPGVIVDGQLQIVQFRGQTGPYLEPAPGDASFSLLRMAREGLVHGLRSALGEARRRDETVRREGLTVHYDGSVRHVNVEVTPLGNTEERFYLVLFEDVQPSAPPPAPEPPKGRKAAVPSQRDVVKLQQELEASRAYLQSIIQDLEAANEELQSANEEILSANEELQSTNEELDTAKEELQSTNEELNTVNEELHGRNEELSRANSDLVNLLASVQIAIIMVDTELRIRRFTPMAERALNLIPGDIGRPISHLKPNIDCPDLEQVIARVIDTVTVEQRLCQDRQGKWYSLVVRPYKNIEKRIDGAVLALFDIDDARRKDLETRRAWGYAKLVADAVQSPLVVLDQELRVKLVNLAFLAWFRVTSDEVHERRVLDLEHELWASHAVRALLQEVLPKDGHVQRYRVELAAGGGAPAQHVLLDGQRISIEGDESGSLTLLTIDPRP